MSAPRPCGGSPSGSPAATATRTRSCPVAGPAAHPKRHWTAPAGCTSPTRAPGPSSDPDHARTYKPDHLVLVQRVGGVAGPLGGGAAAFGLQAAAAGGGGRFGRSAV